LNKSSSFISRPSQFFVLLLQPPRGRRKATEKAGFDPEGQKLFSGLGTREETLSFSRINSLNFEEDER
jgi:hypothetical protein